MGAGRRGRQGDTVALEWPDKRGVREGERCGTGRYAMRGIRPWNWRRLLLWRRTAQIFLAEQKQMTTIPAPTTLRRGSLRLKSIAALLIGLAATSTVYAGIPRFAPSSLNFGIVPVGGSATIAVNLDLASGSDTLRSLGINGFVDMTWATTYSDFQLNLGTCNPAGPTGSLLAPGTSCQFTLTYTPTTADGVNAFVTATDWWDGHWGNMTVTAGALTLKPVTLPAPQVGTAYSQTLTGAGGTLPYGYSVTAGALPAGLSLAPTGVVSGVPSAAGPASFTITITDGVGGTVAKAYNLTVAARPLPIGAVDSYATAFNTALTIAAPGLLGNDSSPLALPLTALLVSGPANGALGLNADGSFTYAPNAGFSGIDTFTYSAFDGYGTPPITVSITVRAGPVTPASIPTLSEWGLIGLSSVLAMFGIVRMLRRQV